VEVLVTGAAGLIGRYLRDRLMPPQFTLRLLDVEPIDDAPADRVVHASATDLDAMTGACRGVDAVVHLASIAGEASWQQIRDVNIESTYVAFEAARRAGVRRVVFASSNHAVGFATRDDAPLGDSLFPAPDTYYGVAKATGEALGAMYHHRYGLDVICLRILTCRDRPHDLRSLSTWLSPDDCGRLFAAALSAPSPGFRVVWGVSDNTRRWVSLDAARALGYDPVDDAERFAPALLAEHGEIDITDPVHHRIGGPFTTSAYDAPVE
jgi:uronate dehydrogenase